MSTSISVQRFGGRGRGGEGRGGEGRVRDGGIETGVGDGSEMGSVMKKKKKIYNWYRCQPHPAGLQG